MSTKHMIKQDSKFSFLFAGESGMGIDSSGAIIMQALAKLGYWVMSNRDFPSLIKGGQAAFAVDCSTKEVYGLSNQREFGVGMGKTGLLYALEHTQPGGTILHNFERRKEGLPNLPDQAAEKSLDLIYVPTREIIREEGLHTIFENTLMIGAFAKFLGIDFGVIKQALHNKYGKKESLWQSNKTMLEQGFDQITSDQQWNGLEQIGKPTGKDGKRMIIDGNRALALGAIHAGVRTYFAYPMSPSSSILSYMAKVADKTGMVVKQVEDEITAAQMCIGASYAGTRSLVATSGGGFDLMTESFSLAGMTEIPLVIVLAQRPGPATGLPTWTAQADLNLAIHAGHGEFARIVMAVGDHQSAYEDIQHALNFAELWQVPVVVLTDKYLAENRAVVEVFEQGTVPIKRGMVTEKEELKNLKSTDRYKITDSGVSKRRVPGSSKTIAFANGDEHHEDGTLDESPGVAAMIQKRIKKLHTIEAGIPAPELFGNTKSDTLYVGWGSTKGPMREAMEVIATMDRAERKEMEFAYCHCTYLHPLKKQWFKETFSNYETIVVVENNATGQFAGILQQAFGNTYTFHSMVKSNGRHFSVEEVLEHRQGMVAD